MKRYKKIHAFYLLMLCRLGLTTSKTYVHIYYARANHSILQYVVSSLIKQYAAIQLLMFAYDR